MCRVSWSLLWNNVWSAAAGGLRFCRQWSRGSWGNDKWCKTSIEMLNVADLSARFEVCKLLAVERSMELIVNSELALLPQLSLVAAVVDEVRPVFFGTESLKADQIEGHVSSDGLSGKLTKSLFSAVISYVPTPMTE
ncbi:MAG: hypothetical protein ACKESB_02750 [Candidatus Hodgkinia cicadicola]